MITTEDKFKIDGSGFFFFKTTVSEESQLLIVQWYDSLPPNHKSFVDILIQEARTDEAFFNQPD